MQSKRRINRSRDSDGERKKQKIDEDEYIQDKEKCRYTLIGGIPTSSEIIGDEVKVEGDETKTEGDEIGDTSDKLMTVSESGVLQASLIESIKTLLHEPVIFKKYYHKIRDTHNINNNISIKIFFLKLSYLTRVNEQPYFYYMPYLNYYKELLRAPNGKHSIKNAPDEVTHQSMNGSMHRLFDTVMQVNNFHQFQIRLFILKNDEIEEEYDLQQSKIKEDLLEAREKTKELKLKAKQDRIERQQRAKEEKIIEKEKQKEAKKQLLITKQKEKELKQQHKAEEKIKREQEKEEKRKEKLLREQQKREKMIKLEEFRKRIADIDLEKHVLKEKERKARAEHMSKHTPKDAKNDNGTSEQEKKALEDKKMIYNLNQMGKKDQHLSHLMKVLASGKGTKEEISEFKTFMDKARKMDAPPGWNSKEQESFKQKKKEDIEKLKKQKKENEESLYEELSKIQDMKKKLQDEKDKLMQEKDSFLREQEEIEKNYRKSLVMEIKTLKDVKKEATNESIKEDQAAEVTAAAAGNEQQSTTEKEVEHKQQQNQTAVDEKQLQNQTAVDEKQLKNEKEVDEKQLQNQPAADENHLKNQTDVHKKQQGSQELEGENSEPVKTEDTTESQLNGDDKTSNSEPTVEFKDQNTEDPDPASDELKSVNGTLKGEKKKKKVPYDEQLTTFQSKYTSKCDLVFEFLDNSNDRYLVPKDSILEYNQSSGVLKLSWVTILNYKEIDQKIPKKKSLRFNYLENMRQLFPIDILQKSGVVPIFVTNTVQFEMHAKFLPILKANLIEQEEVFNTMDWIIKNGQRAETHSVVYRLKENEKKEFDLATKLREEVYKYELARSRFKK